MPWSTCKVPGFPDDDALAGLVSAVPGASWGLELVDVATGAVLASHERDAVLPVASVGKLALLAHVGVLLHDDPGSGEQLLERATVAPVADSGLWQHLAAAELSVADAATLVFATSDNLASNALLAHLGLERVRARADELELGDLHLLDLVRDERGPDAPPTLAVASASSLARFMHRAWAGTLHSREVSNWLVEGMSRNVDLSMVPDALALDPLSHAGPGSVPGVANKTGVDAGIRADTGLLSTPSGVVAYAAICSFSRSATAAPVVRAMRQLGAALSGAG